MTIYLGSFVTKFGWPQNLIHIQTCKISCHVHFIVLFTIWHDHRWSLMLQVTLCRRKRVHTSYLNQEILKNIGHGHGHMSLRWLSHLVHVTIETMQCKYILLINSCFSHEIHDGNWYFVTNKDSSKLPTSWFNNLLCNRIMWHAIKREQHI